MKTFAQFAFTYGQTDRLTHEATLHWHREYTKMEAEQQGEMRDQWILNYLMGSLDVAEPKAQKIVDAKRTERSSAHQQAYDRARGQFAYHIVRKTSAKAEPAKAPRISREERAAWAAFVATVGADRAALIAKTLG
jgi:hypothetical protein